MQVNVHYGHHRSTKERHWVYLATHLIDGKTYLAGRRSATKPTRKQKGILVGELKDHLRQRGLLDRYS